MRRTVPDETGSLVIDLSRADFIDSSVVHALFDARRQSVSVDEVLILQIGPTAIVQRALTLSGVLNLIPAHSAEDAERLLAELRNV